MDGGERDGGKTPEIDNVSGLFFFLFFSLSFQQLIVCFSFQVLARHMPRDAGGHDLNINHMSDAAATQQRSSASRACGWQVAAKVKQVPRRYFSCGGCLKGVGKKKVTR